MSETPEGGRTTARQANGRFGAGNPGRPFGSGNRMSRQVALTLLTHFQANQEELLERLSRWYFSDYVRLLGRLLPRPPVDDGRDEPDAIEAGDALAVAAEIGAAFQHIAEREAQAAAATDVSVKLTEEAGASAEARPPVW